MIFRQFCAPDKQLSYLFADPVTRQAVVLDPHIQLEEEYLEMVSHLDLQLGFVFDSHSHESHLSAAPMLCAETGAIWITSTRMDTAEAARKVVDGECVVMGEECFDVLETPGHSPCSLSLRWRDRVFTGHTLLSGKTGPCNRPDSDPGQLFDSIRDCLYAMPPMLRVYPGYQYGNDESSIGRERSSNKELNVDTPRRSFIELKAHEQGALAGVARPVLARRAGNLYPYFE